MYKNCQPRAPLRNMQPTSVTVTKIKQPHQKTSRSKSARVLKVQTTDSASFDFDVNSYHKIHRTDDSAQNISTKSRSSTRRTPCSTRSYSEIQECHLRQQTFQQQQSQKQYLKPSSTKSNTSTKENNPNTTNTLHVNRQKQQQHHHQHSEYHIAAKKLRDKNKKLLSEIEVLKNENRRANTEKTAAHLRHSRTATKKNDFRTKYSRLKEEYTKTLEELKSIKSKHIATLKHKNQLQTQNLSLSQSLKGKKQQIKQQNERLQRQQHEISELSMGSFNGGSQGIVDDSYIQEMSCILDIDLPDLPSISGSAFSSNGSRSFMADTGPFTLSENVGAHDLSLHQKLLLQKGEEKMKKLKHLESKVSNLESKNRELIQKIKSSVSTKPSKPGRAVTVDTYVDRKRGAKSSRTQTIPELRMQIAELRSTKETQRRFYEKELNATKRKMREIQETLNEMTLNVDSNKIQSQNAELRQKVHEQRLEVTALRSWKTMARKKYVEQIGEIREDVLELQSRSKINQHKFGQFAVNPSRTEHDVEVIQNNHAQILLKIGEVHSELNAILSSYNHAPREVMRESSVSIDQMDDNQDAASSKRVNCRRTKQYRSEMRKIEKLFDIKFDENDRFISTKDMSSVIEAVNAFKTKERRQTAHVTKCDKIIKGFRRNDHYKLNENLMATLFVISSNFSMDLDIEDIPQKLKLIEKTTMEKLDEKRTQKNLIETLKSKLSADKSQFEADIKALQKQIETKSSAVHQWESKFHETSRALKVESDKTRDLMQCKHDNHDLLLQIEDLKIQIIGLQDSINHKEEALNDINARHKSAEKALSETKSDLDSKRKQIKELMERRQTDEAQLSELKGALDSKEKLVQELMDESENTSHKLVEMDSLQNRIEILEESVRSKANELQISNDKLTGICDELTKNQKELIEKEERIRALTEEKRVAEEALSAMEMKVDGFEHNLKALNQRMDTKQRGIQRKEEQIRSLKEEKERMEQEKSTMKIKVESMTQEMDGMTLQLEAKQKEIERLLDDGKQSEQGMVRKEEEIKLLSKEKRSREQEVSSMTLRSKVLEQNLERITGLLNDTQQDMETMTRDHEGEMIRKQKQIRTLFEEKKRAETQYDELSMRVQEMNNGLNSSLTTMGEQQREIERLNTEKDRELAVAAEQILKLKEEKKIAEGTQWTLELKVESIEKEWKRVQHDLEQKEKYREHEVMEREAELCALTQEKEDAQRQMKELQRLIACLEEKMRRCTDRETLKCSAINALKQKVSDLEQDLSSKKEQVSSLRELEDRHNAKLKEIEILEQKRLSLERALESNKSQLTALKKQYDSVTGDLGEKQSEIAVLNEKNQISRKMIDSQSQLITKLKEQQTETLDRADGHSMECEELKDQIEGLQISIDAKNRKIGDLANTLVAIKREKVASDLFMKRRATELESLTTEKGRLKTLYEKAIEEQAQSEATVNKQQECIEKLMGITKNLEDKLDAQCLEVETQSTKFEGQMVKYRERVEALQESESKIRSHCERLQNEVNLMKNEKIEKEQMFQESMNSKDAELDQLNRRVLDSKKVTSELRHTVEQLMSAQENGAETAKLRENYMMLNDKYATALLEINNLRFDTVERESEIQSEMTKMEHSVRVRSEQLQRARSETQSIYELIHDLKESSITAQEAENSSKDQQSDGNRSELDEYLKRLDSIHTHFDSNLLHISGAKLMSLSTEPSVSPDDTDVE